MAVQCACSSSLIDRDQEKCDSSKIYPLLTRRMLTFQRRRDQSVLWRSLIILELGPARCSKPKILGTAWLKKKFFSDIAPPLKGAQSITEADYFRARELGAQSLPSIGLSMDAFELSSFESKLRITSWSRVDIPGAQSSRVAQRVHSLH